MKKILEITYLFDFYQGLLTQKQRDLISAYYFEDLSLGELAITYQISRQSIFDTIKKAERKLIDYEEKLALYEKFKKQEAILNQLEHIIENSQAEQAQLIDLISQLRNEI